MKFTKIRIALITALIMSVLVSCENFLNNNNNEGSGNLKISITDAPFPLDIIESANVVITKIEVHAVNDTSGSPFTVVMEDTVEFNLLDLRNGVTAEVVYTDLPAGAYDQVRLYVDSASITLVGGISFELKVPSGSQTGIKLKIDPAITIAGGELSELLLDFDIEKSFVLKGNMNTPAGIKGFNFKPVIRVCNHTVSGKLEGMVSDTAEMALEYAQVWIESDTVVATAYTDSTGYYAIPGILEGSYDFFATLENYDTVMVGGIEIVAGNTTMQDAVLTPAE